MTMSAYVRSTARKAWSRANAGVASIEFAFLAPVFLVMVFYGMQLSLGLHKSNTVERAIEQATRKAFLSGATTQSEIQSTVTARLHEIDPSLSVTIAYSVDGSTTVPTGTVTASYSFEIETFFLPAFDLDRNVAVKIPLPQA